MLFFMKWRSKKFGSAVEVEVVTFCPQTPMKTLLVYSVKIKA